MSAIAASCSRLIGLDHPRMRAASVSAVELSAELLLMEPLRRPRAKASESVLGSGGKASAMRVAFSRGFRIHLCGKVKAGV